MKTTLKWGLILGVLCEIWAYIYVAAGWHKSPSTFGLFWFVIPIQIVVLVLALRETAAQGRGYGGQIVAGTVTSIVGAVVIMAASYVCMTVVFPNYCHDVLTMQEQALRAAGKSEADIRQIMDMAAKTTSPVAASIAGGIGTVVTGLLASLLIGAFVRARKVQPA